jgi:thiosulfate reductase / polysulfide reductase chain A
MNSKLSRRDFLKASTAGAAIAGATTATAESVPHPPGRRGNESVDLIPTNCEMCFWRCGVLAEVKNGKVLKLQGNPHHPMTRGKLCARGNSGTQLLNDPNRLKYPELRTGSRGAGKFKRVSWDEALDQFAGQLKEIRQKYGPESVALFNHGVASGFFGTLMKAYGTPNSAEPAFAQCVGPRDVAYTLTFGRPVNSPEPVDLAESKLIVLIGSHIGENVFTSQVTAFSAGLSRGAKLLVVDPRLSTAASKANWWLPIKPGSDTALLLAWANVLIAEDLYDKEFIDQYASGFKELAAHVQPFTPEWAEALTEIPAAQIRETARAMGAAKPAVALHPGRHTTWYGNDTQRARAMAIVTALLGAYGRKGGIFLPTKVKPGTFPHPPMPDSEKGRADGGGDTYPLAAEESQGLTQGLIEATLSGKPYPIKAWVVYGANILESIPRKERTLEAIKKLDLLVVVDVLPNQQTDYADIVLPEATYLERYDPPMISTTSKPPFISIRQPACEPMYETKPGWWIAKQMAKRLDLDAYFPWSSPEDHLRGLIAPLGVNITELMSLGAVALPGRPYIEDRTEADGPLFPTTSGKLELYSSALNDLHFDPLPVYQAPEQPPSGFLRLIYGRAAMHSFTRTEDNAWLDDLMPKNQVWISTRNGAQLQLREGDIVTLENQDGFRSNPIHVRITERIRDDCAFMVHGFGQIAPKERLANGQGASDNQLLTRIAVDPIMGGTGMRVNFVRVLANQGKG